MTNIVKRSLFGRHKGYFIATGTQGRFIVFLLTVLIVFTFLLRVFQKLAEIVQFPVFFPVSLLTLLLFVGAAGTIYSHSFIGPIIRIRKAVKQMSEGNFSVSLTMRESDDPLLKDLGSAISALSESSRNSHLSIQDASNELLAAVNALEEKISRGGNHDSIRSQVEIVKTKKEFLDRMVRLHGKPLEQQHG